MTVDGPVELSGSPERDVLAVPVPSVSALRLCPKAVNRASGEWGAIFIDENSLEKVGPPNLQEGRTCEPQPRTNLTYEQGARGRGRREFGISCK